VRDAAGPPPDHRPAPSQVDRRAYDERYYRKVCAGAHEWSASEGSAARGMYAGYVHRAAIGPGEVVVDLGTGRGELLVAALAAGARGAVGIEYSPDGVVLAARTLAAAGVVGPAAVVAADVRWVPVRGGRADVVTMLDVVEHLTPAELHAALREAHRLLRPGGRLLIHTMPTRTVYEVTYRVQRLLAPWRWRRWPRDPRSDEERAMHVNEMTRRRLDRALVDAGFAERAVEVGAWIWDGFVPSERARRTYARLARFRLTRPLGACDLWATARRSTSVHPAAR
jgi:SAM-dependent methyltransferase